jgi:hypothetical protein
MFRLHSGPSAKPYSLRRVNAIPGGLLPLLDGCLSALDECFRWIPSGGGDKGMQAEDAADQGTSAQVLLTMLPSFAVAKAHTFCRVYRHN